MAALRVLELYSGMGGMHYALRESGVAAQVVSAIDVNTTANEIYRHNFPDTPLWPKTIEMISWRSPVDYHVGQASAAFITGRDIDELQKKGITLEEFNKLSFDVILMSPPCQPFTRIGLQGDMADPRTKSFIYILDLLPRLTAPPRFILLENVKGFETSSARESLLRTLTECGYSFQEMMISPTSLGIPNSRLRYFLIAKALPGRFCFRSSSDILDGFPGPAGRCCRGDREEEEEEKDEEEPEAPGILYKLETALDAQRKRSQNADPSVRQIGEFLELGRKGRGGGGEGEREEEQEEEEEEEEGKALEVARYLLPAKTLLRYALLMDIVRPTCRRSVCFTKGYGHYVEGTGSVLQSCMEAAEMESVFKGLDQLEEEEEKLRSLSRLKLRYFTPREIANLMGFPQSFSFPETTSTKQQYRVLGNSLNVLVVARLIRLMVA